MAELVPGLTAVTGPGVLRQKQHDYYLLRIKAVAGDLSASQLACIAEVAEQYHLMHQA